MTLEAARQAINALNVDQLRTLVEGGVRVEELNPFEVFASIGSHIVLTRQGEAREMFEYLLSLSDVPDNLLEMLTRFSETFRAMLAMELCEHLTITTNSISNVYNITNAVKALIKKKAPSKDIEFYINQLREIIPEVQDNNPRYSRDELIESLNETEEKFEQYKNELPEAISVELTG